MHLLYFFTRLSVFKFAFNLVLSLMLLMHIGRLGGKWKRKTRQRNKWINKKREKRNEFYFHFSKWSANIFIYCRVVCTLLTAVKRSVVSWCISCKYNSCCYCAGHAHMPHSIVRPSSVACIINTHRITCSYATCHMPRKIPLLPLAGESITM